MLNRVALTITRKQSYVDWANGTDGPMPVVAYPEDNRRTVYLAPVGRITRHEVAATNRRARFPAAHCGGVLRIASAADPARPRPPAVGVARLVRRDLGLA